MSEPGGFVITLNPPQSSPESEANPPLLPQPGSKPLKSRDALVQVIDRSLLHISRRYEKRCPPVDQMVDVEHDENSGYSAFTEMANDLGKLIDDVWISGTPKLQMSTLLSISLTSCTSLSAFPFAPRASFHLFKKLDEAFYSLLTGNVSDTGEPLPGLEGGRGIPTITEMIRLRGIAERTRVAVVEAAGSGENEGDEESLVDSGIGQTTDDDGDEGEDEDHDELSSDTRNADDDPDLEMEIARVYERTISQLGQHLNSL